MNMANDMQQQPKQTTTEDNSVEAKLAKIKSLFDKGLISQEDYDTKKSEIIASL
jgi:hypothetical protein